MLDRIRQLLGVKEIPEEISKLYRGAKTEREALILLKEARRRDDMRRKRAMQDLEVLDQMEEELLEEGQANISENRKLMLARRIKEIRWKAQELNGRIDQIYNKRLKVYNEHISSLETVLELTNEELPDLKTMEEMSIRAKNLLEDLEKAKELAEGIQSSTETPQPDDEEREIMKEMERRAEVVEQETPKPEPEVKEAPKREKKQQEKPSPEKKTPESPEIEYED